MKSNVKKQIENGREFITELKADPVKRIDDLIDDSREAIEKSKGGPYENHTETSGYNQKRCP